MHPSAFKSNVYPLLKLALPLALTNVMQSAIYFFETIFLAHLGAEFIAAGALVSWLSGVLAVILFGTLSSINIFVSHHYGAKDHQTIALVFRDGLLLAIGLSVLGFLLFWNMSPVFIFFKQSPAIVTLSNAYLRAMAWGLLPNYLIIAFLELIVGLGHARLILAYTVLSASLTIFFSYILIFGKWGFPALNIAGAGWGITISNWIMVFVLAIYLLTHQPYQGYFNAIFKKTKPCYLWELLKVGLPIGFMYCIEVGFFFAMTLVMGFLGSAVLAANQIGLQYMGMLMNAAFALAQAITVRMGHLLGAKDVKAAANVAPAGLMLIGTLMCFVALVYWFFPGMLIAIDFKLDDPANSEIIRDAKQFLAVSAVFQILEACRIALFGALRALKDTRFTLLISFFSFWMVALPLGYSLAVNLAFQGRGLWWGMVVGAGSSLILLGWRFKSKMRNRILFQDLASSTILKNNNS